VRELIGHGQYAKPEAIKQPGSNDIIAHLSFGQMSLHSVCSSMGRVKSLQGFEVGWAIGLHLGTRDVPYGGRESVRRLSYLRSKCFRLRALDPAKQAGLMLP